MIEGCCVLLAHDITSRLNIPDPARLVRAVNKAGWLEQITRYGRDPHGLARG